jgi:hypothetical protein
MNSIKTQKTDGKQQSTRLPSTAHFVAEANRMRDEAIADLIHAAARRIRRGVSKIAASLRNAKPQTTVQIAPCS